MRIAGIAALCAALLASSQLFAAEMEFLPGFAEGLQGPQKAKGVIIWSHGRSINAEDSKSPTPEYLLVLQSDGWDVMRFNRKTLGDTLIDSSAQLVKKSIELKRQGYKQVVLAGQSFGAWISLMAADHSTNVDAVIATSPAAYGSFDDFYDSWRLNAIKLYPLLSAVQSARVMLFYFHGDDFDPGGRGERSRAILAHSHLGYTVVDQPALLTGHWAAGSGLFVRRFGPCIQDFADSANLRGELVCNPASGN